MIDGDRVVHEVRYAHPVRAVWRALTDPAELAAWLMPNDFAPTVGHRFRLDAQIWTRANIGVPTLRHRSDRPDRRLTVKTIHHVVDIDAGTESVWSALTEPDQMAGWWSTKLRTPPAAVGAQVEWTFAGDFNPVMEIITLDQGRELGWRCVSGHDPWQDSIFRFELAALDDRRTKLCFWQDYAVELADDYYGVYNFNWGYYLESLRLLCATGTGKPFPAQS